MCAVTECRYREASVNAFREVLVRWLEELPADGWDGGVGEVGEALWEITRRAPSPTDVPFGSGLGRAIAVEQGILRAQGLVVQSRRAKHARTLRFTRTGEGCYRWANTGATPFRDPSAFRSAISRFQGVYTHRMQPLAMRMRGGRLPQISGNSV